MQSYRLFSRASAGLVIVTALCAAASPASAQENNAPIVIALSKYGTAQDISSDESRAIEPKDELDGRRVRVDDAQAAMIYCKSGRVTLLVLGPATFSTAISDEFIDITLESGRLIALARKAGATQPVRLVIPGATPDDEPRLTMPFGDGTVFARVQGATVDVGYDGLSGGGSLAADVAGESASLASGQRLVLENDAAQSAALDPWRAEAGFDRPSLGEELAFALARVRRGVVAERLQSHIIEWDTFALAPNVKATLSASLTKPEVRSVNTVLTSLTPNVSTITANASRLTGAAATANQVPPLSPAAIAVGGISAVSTLNSRAAGLLNSTQARGLGFGGLSLLAIPGFQPTGTRTIGPPGLGARP